MERRIAGKTGVALSIVGFGGIVVTDEEQSEADRLVAMAIDRGVNYFDVAPSYGNAEERLGPALRGKRDRVFLACKTAKRIANEAMEELHRSLDRLETDRIDLYQLHAMTTEEDFQAATGPGGALDAFLKAREKGLIRFIGFSAHSVETALKLMDAFDFDTTLFPVNWVNYFNAGFGGQVVERAQDKGMGCLALKAMAKCQWGEHADRRSFPKAWYEPISDPALAELAFRFTLTQPVAAAIPPGDKRSFRQALEFAERFKPLDHDEVAELKEMAAGLSPIFQLAHNTN